MPIYTWVSKKSGKAVEVVRHFNEYEVPPTEKEASEEEHGTEWERVISRTQKHQYGPNFVGRKGYW